MNRITSARTELLEAISPVLVGRVAPTPPAAKPYPPPYIWLDQPELNVASIGSRSQITVATFPIWIGYDGAAKAQIVGLDDLVAKVWDACLHVPAARPVSAIPQLIDVGGTTVRGVVISTDVTLGALTLCLPELATIPIPPEPVPA